MPNSEPTLGQLETDIAVLQTQIANLEKLLESTKAALKEEFNDKHSENKGDIKQIRMALAKVSRNLNKIELRIARYAGGAGVLTAIAIKVLDKIIH